MMKKEWKPIIDLMNQAPVDALRGMHYLAREEAWVVSNGYVTIHMPAKLGSKPIKSDCFIPLDKILRHVSSKRRDEDITLESLFGIAHESTFCLPLPDAIVKDTERTETLLANKLVELVLRAMDVLVGGVIKLEPYKIDGKPAIKLSSVSGEGAYAYVMGCALKEEDGKEE